MRKLLPVLFLLPLMVFAQSGVIGHHGNVLDSSAVWFPDPGSRGLTAGSDLDGDGKLEVFATNYSYGGIVMGFELAADTSLLELVWFSDTNLTASGSSSGTRMVQTGDLDGDGLGEIVFFRGYAPDPATKPDDGLRIYEYNGSDNGYDLVYSNNLQYLGTDSISTFRPEYFVIDDVDGDGKQELIVASNGTSFGKDRSEDQFTVLSITGNMGTDPFVTLVEEFYVSARENSNALGGGSAINVAISDIDGDGMKEVYCAAWNSHNNFFFEATGPDTYSLGDTTNVQISLGVGDHVSLMQSVAADLDGDGKDEVYTTNYNTGDVYRITDKNGDGATTFAADEVDTLALAIGASFGATAGDFDDDGNLEVVFGGSVGANGDLIMWDGTDFTSWNSDEVAGGFVTKLAAADLNGNGVTEIVTAHQSVPDSVDGAQNWHYWFVRSSEIGATTTIVTEYAVITPDDYVLYDAYPNPFNPSTMIEFKLPLAKDISLIVYNMRGQEVVRLADNSSYGPGNHRLVWNGLDAAGNPVATGVYIYTLRYGNFHQSKRVTFLK
jgi:hypothetical protein